MYTESPKPTEINPNIMYGTTFNFLMSWKLTRTLLFLALVVLNASFKLVLSAALIGGMALKNRIRKPIARAYSVAFASGQTVGWNPISSVKSNLYIIQIQGNAHMKPAMTEGNTKHAACVKIIPKNPFLLKPTKRITPISKVFVSTEIIKSEYISKMAIPINMRSNTSNMRPINRISMLEVPSILPRRSNSVVSG